MTEVDRIVDMLKRTFYKEAWHGGAFLEILEGVTAKQAFSKPIPKAHSIWEIVLHTQTWIDAVRIRTSGKEYKVSEEQDWPTVTNKSEAAWKKTIDSLKKSHKKLEKHAASFKTSDLNKKAGGSTLTNYILLHSIIHHNTYHAAQIALLKKKA
jgi:uncharacterized damage-inducible protein DinB